MKIVTFGELMLRLGPVGFERLFQTPALQASFGGAEANVAVSLAHFGHESHYVTRVPAHAVGEAALAMLRSHGVRTGHIQKGGERLGIYFAETGASQRPSTVIYDRAFSSISQIEPRTIDWRDVLEGAAWFHWSGITPALGEGAAACVREAVETAAAAGVPISVDLNYRRKLWTEARAGDHASARPPRRPGDRQRGGFADGPRVRGPRNGRLRGSPGPRRIPRRGPAREARIRCAPGRHHAA